MRCGSKVEHNNSAARVMQIRARLDSFVSGRPRVIVSYTRLTYLPDIINSTVVRCNEIEGPLNLESTTLPHHNRIRSSHTLIRWT